MTYDCINGWEDIIGNLVERGDMTIPLDDADDTAAVADIALRAINAMRIKANVIHGRQEAMRTMLGALKVARTYLGDDDTDDSPEARGARTCIVEAIAQAEGA